MRRSNTQKLADIINDSFKDFNIGRKLKEVELINCWERVVGKTVARYTENIYIKNKKLMVFVNSSVVKNELLMIRDPLINRLNKEVGEEVISEIVIR